MGKLLRCHLDVVSAAAMLTSWVQMSCDREADVRSRRPRVGVPNIRLCSVCAPTLVKPITDSTTILANPGQGSVFGCFLTPRNGSTEVVIRARFFFLLFSMHLPKKGVA